MVMYDRSASTGYRLVDEFEDGFGWLAFPDETGQRVSHAVVGEDGGVWVIDPLDAPGIDEVIRELGDVSGIAVCSAYHARDADRFADRFDVPVYVPRWLKRAPERIDAPIERYDTVLSSSGFAVREVSSIPGWSEAVAYRESDGTLYVPDVLGTYADDGRVELALFFRLVPPTETFADLEPERIRFGHGRGVFEDATGALEDALSRPRRGFPWALYRSGWTQLKAGIAAFR